MGEGKNDIEKLRSKAAGFRANKNKNDGAVVRLCGEKFQEGVDPSMDTRIQRSWLYFEDPSLDRNGLPQEERPKEDNELSLPLGDGAQEVIMRNLEYRITHGTGMLYKSKTDVTKDHVI